MTDHDTAAAADALLMEGFQLHQAGRLAEAQRRYRQVLELLPAQFDALHLLGVASHQSGRAEAAVRAIESALAIRDDYAPAHLNLANSLRVLGRLDDAVAHYERAITLDPGYADAYSNLGVVLQDLKQSNAALRHCNRAIALNARHAEAFVNRGNILLDLRRLEAAVADYDQALAISPGLAAAHYNRGEALRQLRRHDDAVAAYEAAIAANPNDPLAHFHRGHALLELRRPDAAAASFGRALAIEPDLPYGPGYLLHAQLLACDWQDVARQQAAIEQAVLDGRPAVRPFDALGWCDSDRLMHAVATLYSNREHPALTPLVAAAAGGAGRRIRIGYLCGEFRSQATAALMAGVWDAHDSSRFEIVAFDSGWNDGSEMRRRIEAAFDEMVDIAGLSDEEAARRIASMRIDILVNLNGFFGQARQGVFARRPAAVQVNYLGFPGTIGAPYIDYIVCDATVVPPQSHGHFAEKVARLPNSYQANDRKRAIGARPGGRSESGLPRDAFVYCCFNASYKIGPDAFAAWMRILHAVASGVLWLIEETPVVAANLRRAAARAGIDPERLVFARRVPLAEHLARHACADLFLDTWPCNAHTTASDALWAGLPVLTRVGGSFAGRVGASLLAALGLPELVTPDTAAYEAEAVALARDAARLASMSERLAANRLRQPLFDTELTTRHLEAAFAAMHARAVAGSGPADLEIRGVGS